MISWYLPTKEATQPFWTLVTKRTKEIPVCFRLRCLNRESRVAAAGAEIGSGKRVPDALSAL